MSNIKITTRQLRQLIREVLEEAGNLAPNPSRRERAAMSAQHAMSALTDALIAIPDMSTDEYQEKFGPAIRELRRVLQAMTVPPSTSVERRLGSVDNSRSNRLPPTDRRPSGDVAMGIRRSAGR